MTNIKYAGKDFRQDLGLYVDSIESYGTPKKSYTFHEVLGRNGSLAVDDHRFEDHEETFNCYIRQDFVPNFRNVQAFFNSLKGYQRLERSNEPDYFEMGLYEGEISPRPTQLLQAGAFPFRLRLHPEKWLKSGETAVDAASTSETLEGKPVQFENPSGLTALTGLSVDLEPVQNLNGYDAPWVGGAGKNKLKTSATTQTINGVTFTVNDDGTVSLSGTSTGRANFSMPLSVPLVDGDYILSGCPSGGSGNTYYQQAYASGSGRGVDTGNGVALVSPTSEITRIVITIRNADINTDGLVFKPMIRLATETDATYAPYENICPISGHTSATVTRTVDGSATDYTIDLNGTRYGGTLDVLTGVLTINRLHYTMTGDASAPHASGMKFSKSSSTTNNIYYALSSGGNVTNGSGGDVVLCSHFVNQGDTPPRCYVSSNQFRVMLPMDSDIQTANDMNAWVARQYANGTPLEYCVTLITPTTVQLTAQQVSLLTGTNIISTDMNSLTVTISSPAELENPTLFESKPLIRVYGNGTVNINNDYITIDSASPFTFIDLDCETMNASSAGNNANQYIEILNDAEITLNPGTNYVTYSGSITKVEITPRWYTI